jgi:hypothetical protein
MGIVLAATLDQVLTVISITSHAVNNVNGILKDAAELAIKIAGQGSLELAPRDLSFPKRGRLRYHRVQSES